MTAEDEAWARDILAKIQAGAAAAAARRDELADAVDELAAGLSALGGERWRVRRGTAGRADEKAPSLTLGSRRETVSQVLHYESKLNVLSASDQLRGFALLLRAEKSLMGAVSVSRGVFEASLWAAAVIEPQLSTDERLQRALTRRLARLAAGIRLDDLLSGARASSQEPADDIEVEDDEHGSARDPAEDIAAIIAYAKGRGWKVKKGRRAYEINGPLTIDWLTENLERRIGIEGYAWTSGSSMSHGEHAADTASWVSLANENYIAPAWLMRLWSTGAWAGPRLLLATFAAYTGRPALERQYGRFESAFWNVGTR